MFGRWPITIAYFVSAANDLERLWGGKGKRKPNAGEEGGASGSGGGVGLGSEVRAATASVDQDPDRGEEGNRLKLPFESKIQDTSTVKELPESLKGDTYEAAMYFKAYLTQLAKEFCALPMVPTFWEVSTLSLSISFLQAFPLNPCTVPHLVH